MKENIELFFPKYPTSTTLRINSFETRSESNKFIKSCEKIIRGSPEYREWKNYLINVLQDNFCPITLESSQEVSIEIHHHIPSLFLLVKSVVNKHLDNNDLFCSFDISLEIMSLHYSNLIGYVPLVKTIHEKFHNGFLEIPISLIKGNYQKYLEDYATYLDQEDIEGINNRLLATNFPDTWKKNEYPGIPNYTQDEAK